MFDRTNFDRTLYDRSSTFDNIETTLRSTSKLTVGVVVQVYLEPFTLSGHGAVTASPRMLQVIPIDLSGAGEFGISDFRLSLRFTASMTGTGSITPEIGVRVPFTAAFDGSSAMAISSKMYFLQTVIGNLSGVGGLVLPLTLRVFMDALMSGSGELSVNDKFKLSLPISTNFNGGGEITLRRIGALNSETLEFDNLNLQPGQTLIIDSDELNVFVDNNLDVSSVTSDSVFFQLQPGENEITFASNENQNLAVTIIWQNRWL